MDPATRSEIVEQIATTIWHGLFEEPPMAPDTQTRMRLVADAVLGVLALEQVGWWSGANQRFNRMWEHNPEAPDYRGDRVPVFRLGLLTKEHSE